MPTETTVTPITPAAAPVSTEPPVAGAAAATAVPTPGQATATPAPVELKGTPKSDHRAAVVAALAAKRATTTTDKPAEVREDAPVAPAAPSVVAEPAKDVPVVAQPAAEAPKDDELEAARRLNEIAQAGRRVQQARREAEERQAARDRELAAREAAIAEKDKAERELSSRLAAAKTSGKRLEILRAAGVPEDDLRGSFFVDALAELTEDETPGQNTAAKQAVKTLTEDEVRELIKQQREEERQSVQRQQQEQQAAALKAQQDQYFGLVVAEFARGDYPILRGLPPQIQPTMGAMHDYLMEHYRKTGESLTPPQLLGAYEKTFRDAGFVPRGAPAAPKPAQMAPASTVRTISQAATSDAGEQRPSEEPKKERKMSDIRREGFEKWKASRGAKG